MELKCDETKSTNGTISLSAHPDSFLKSLENSGLEKIFSIYISRDLEKIITLGGYDIEYSMDPSVLFEFSYNSNWELNIDGIYFAGLVKFMNTVAYIDVNSETITGPVKDIEEIFTYLLEHFTCTLSTFEYLECSCGNDVVFPDFTFNVFETDISVPGDLLVESIGGDQCKVMIGYHDNEFWSFGTIFLKAFYTVYDLNSGKIIITPSLYEIEEDSGDATEESTGYWLLTGEIIAGCIVIFIIARVTYGFCEKIEFSIEQDTNAPMVPSLDPDSLLAKKIKKLKEPAK